MFQKISDKIVSVYDKYPKYHKYISSVHNVSLNAIIFATKSVSNLFNTLKFTLTSLIRLNIISALGGAVISIGNALIALIAIPAAVLACSLFATLIATALLVDAIQDAGHYLYRKMFHKTESTTPSVPTTVIQVTQEKSEKSEKTSTHQIYSAIAKEPVNNVEKARPVKSTTANTATQNVAVTPPASTETPVDSSLNAPAARI